MRTSPMLGPNSTVNRPVWPARLESASPCPGRASLPAATETATGWARPGPVMLAWVVPFASAGVASVTVTVRAAPTAREVRAMNLRGMVGGSFLSAGNPQPFRAVQPDLGDVAQVDELLEIDRVQVAVEFVQPYLAVRRAIVDQRRDPSA